MACAITVRYNKIAEEMAGRALIFGGFARPFKAEGRG
jgi:hypothetical protein